MAEPTFPMNECLHLAYYIECFFDFIDLNVFWMSGRARYKHLTTHGAVNINDHGKGICA